MEVLFWPDDDLSERVIFPVTDAQANGIEDARLKIADLTNGGQILWTEDAIGRSPRRSTAITRCTPQAQTRSNPIPRAFIYWSSFCLKWSTLAEC